jgi:glycosyltransferase involved in cell wall biosynthesis
MRLDLSVVVPLYNEGATIEELYARLTKVLGALGCAYELIFVDDGSQDVTYQHLCAIQASDARTHVIRFRRNFGQTAALAAGFEFAEGEVILAMDGDLQHQPEEIPRLLAPLQDGYDIVSGWRTTRVDGFWGRRLPSWVANAVMAWLSGLPLHDFGTTFKAYRREVIKNVDLFGQLHRFIPALATLQGVSVAEVPITHVRRRGGVSKYGFSRTWQVLFDLLLVKFFIHYLQRPLQFFGLWGVGMAGLGFLILTGVAVLKLVFQISIYEYLGSLLLGMLLVILGVQLLAVGLATEVSARIYHTVKGWKLYTVRDIRSARSDHRL